MRKIAIYILGMMLSVGVVAQERPKIGLALSGGGAKGLAHIGILQAIDSAGLNIDYITGTSMGSIIGGMYAAGYSAQEIRRFAGEMDWMGAIMGSSVNYDDLNIDARDSYNRFLLELPIEGKSIKISTGILDPLEVMLKLQEVFFPVYNVNDFTDLPIPFKCIAADIGTGKAVVMSEGDLPFATRSSMAMPGIFSATRYEGTKLVDGGVVRNFPVRDVKDMGADMVIGVNLFAGLDDVGKIDNFLSVMMQIINFSDASDLVEEKNMCDMLIEPDMTGFSASSFDAADSLLAIGDSLGREFYPYFKQMADWMHSEYGVEYARKNRMRPHPESVRIIEFEIQGLKYTEDKQLIRHLNLELGQEYTVHQLNDAIRHAFTSQSYQRLRYELEAADNYNGVKLKLFGEDLPPSHIKIGLSYNTFTNATIMLGADRKDLFRGKSDTEVKLAISQNPHFRLQHKQYWGDEYHRFTGFKFDVEQYDVPIYDGENKQAQYDYLHTDFRLGNTWIVSKRTDLSVFGGYEIFGLEPDMIKDTLTLDGRVSNLYVGLRRRANTLNRPYLPERGILAEINAYLAFNPRYKLGDDFEKPVSSNVYRVSYEGHFYIPLHKKRTTLGIHAAAVASYDSRVFVHNAFLGGEHSFLPSHFTFTGLETAQFNSPTLATAGLSLQYRVYKDLYLLATVNSAARFLSLDSYVNDEAEIEVDDWVHGAGATLAYYNTLLPMEVTLAWSEDYKFSVNVNVGFYF